MERRSFGNGLSVSVLGIGCGRVGSVNNPVPMREIERTLEAAIESGVNLFDTADIYGQGDSERTLSRLLRRHRSRMFVVTKVGRRHGRYVSAIRIAKPILRMLVRSKPQLRASVVRARTTAVSDRFKPRDLQLALEGSRRRLGLDQLDGLLLHSPSVETLQDSGVHDFLCQALQNRRVTCVGASVESLQEVEAVLAMPVPITLLQVPSAVASTFSESTVEQLTRRNIGVFVRGIISDLSASRQSPREAICAALRPQVVTAAIIGLSSRHHLQESLSAIS